MAAVCIFVFMQLVLIGTSECAPRRNILRLERQMEDMSKVFHQEVINLKVELQSLKTELTLEQETTASLVDLLNETRKEAPADNYESRNENIIPAASTKEYEKLQTDVNTIRLAFSDEKNKLTETVDQLKGDIESVNKYAARNEADIRLLHVTIGEWNKITAEIKNEAGINADSILEIRDTLLELAENCSERFTSSRDVDVTPTIAMTDTTLEPATEPPAETYLECREAIRAGGSRAAELMYIGATVKRGPDWTWNDQDRGGHGQIVQIPENRRYYWTVQWDYSTFRFAYRMGKDGKYELDLVEEKFDFSKCPLE